MSSNHFYPEDEGIRNKPTVRRPSTQIDAAALLNALPADKADRLRLRVDKNSDGGIDVDELGELFAELEKDERKISHLRWFLALAIAFLAISIGANFGTSMYAAEKARSTASKTEEVPSIVTTKPAKLLTDTEGNILRTDRSLDEAPMTSQLPDTAFDELEYLRIVGPTG